MSASEDSCTERTTRSSSAKKEKAKMATPTCKEKLSTEAMLEQISSQLTVLQNDVGQLKSTQGTVTTIESNMRGYDERLKEIEDIVSSDNLQIKLLTDVVIKQESEIEELKQKLRSYQKKDIKNNMIFGGIIEEKDEDCIGLVQKFIKEQLKISQTIQILNAYRQGPKKPDSSDFTRNIIAKFKNVSDKGVIFEHVSNLAGKKNARKKLFVVKDHLLEDDQETRNFYRQLVKENNKRFSSDDEDKLKIKMKKDKILINSTPISQPVLPPKGSDILKLTDGEKELVRQFKTANGKTLTENGSDFYSHAAKVSSIRDVNRVYSKMKMKYGDATHIMCAYRLAEPGGVHDQQAIDDGEYGGARRVLDELKTKEARNTAIFIIRYHPKGSPNLGLRRFEIIKDLSRSAYKALLDKLTRKRARQMSQGSLASALSSADDEYQTLDQDSQASITSQSDGEP